MKILTLTLSLKHFNQVLTGSKKRETRELTPINFSRYIEFMYNGFIYSRCEEIPNIQTIEFETESIQAEGKSITFLPKPYDAIKYVVKTKSDQKTSLLIQITESNLFFFLDDKGNDLTYQYQGITYVMAKINYQLGAIISTHNVEWTRASKSTKANSR